MLFNVAGLTVEVSLYVCTNINVGSCCAYVMYVQHTILKGGGYRDISRKIDRGGGGDKTGFSKSRGRATTGSK